MVTLKGFDRCYFHNEAVSAIGVNGVAEGCRLVAKVIAGVYDAMGVVVECRADAFDNVETRTYPIAELDARIQAGTFRASGIRKGARG
jgi:hypothetical protein